uniref:Hydroxyacylglutathione hydrolase like n=1 Tax=Zosterops lateralis melanops TaxID=1220523 RepID=A0A8D2NYW7_ZOSLA
MKVKVISVLEDNYMYLVIEESTRQAVAVDAAVPKRLLEIIRKEDVVLRAILTTHHHWDHARGNEELAQLFPGLQVFGADERIGALTHRVTHGQELTFGAIRVRCLFTPCHTSGHMCYFMWEDDSPDAPALFSGIPAMAFGDTLPVCCLSPTLSSPGVNPATPGTPIPKVFCGHECTVRNLKFALKVEPENEAVKEKLAWARQRDDEDLPTVPSTLQEEFLYNPFLRLTIIPSVPKFPLQHHPFSPLQPHPSLLPQIPPPAPSLFPMTWWEIPALSQGREPGHGVTPDPPAVPSTG